MREIKFRAWDNTSMAIGGQVMLGWDDLSELVIHGIFLTDILNDNDTEGLVPMQYTGLKDKNGVEIYEGDILNNNSRIDKKDLLIIEGGASGMYVATLGRKYEFVKSCVGEPQSISYLMESEVVGNIYENKDLLN